MKTRLGIKPISLGSLCMAMCFGTMAYAQDTNTQGTTNTTTTNSTKTAKSAASGLDQYPDLVEIDPFGGITTSGQVMRGLTTKLVDGWVGGLRLTYNPSAYLGIELWADMAQGNVEFRQSSGLNPATGAPLPAYGFFG